MKLGELLQGVEGLKFGAHPAVEVPFLAYDSRRVKAGALFFAIIGEKADGHKFIPAALKSGAVAIVSERRAPPELAPQWVEAPRIRRALATASLNFYRHPDSRLRLVGITGTNGKTTTSYLIESIFRAAGIRAGLFGTIEYRFGDRTLPALNTTPESLDLISYLAELADSGGGAAVMEVSSHALAQERVWGLHFAAAVFTNLTRDHLDYHKDFESYFQAKRRLFEGLGAGPPELAVINADDPWAVRLLELPYPRRLTYAIGSEADLKMKYFSQSAAGLEASLATPQGKLEVRSPLLGRANVYNILAAAAATLGLGVPADKVQRGIAALACVPGRFERVDEGQPFLVVVDYAHTDDALRNVLRTARELTRRKLIVVFGCGGDRDRAKRPLMGEAAGSLSDLVVLTSDNPRSEDPVAIMNDALVGLQKAGKPYRLEVDRQAAIRLALEDAREGDVVVLAGKGHETYQILKDRTIPFDDRAVARQVLGELGYAADQASAPRRNPARH
ncbi:MAG TPA: UDP-N-acetylmuramoyl-L-alanyl-D-glutamate--2,6-diaminopimelate ligase [Terriglobia bacterium]|nr:UDP-N-acetylmuramoyl-L-alanyl-D-glutamate--2,6-diaminopimelate ligase [Terriglobia bacterium]